MEFKYLWENYLKRRAKITLIAVMIVFLVIGFIVFLSKINEYQKSLVPYVWKGRMKLLVQDATRKLNEAKKYATQGNEHLASQHIIESNATFDVVKRLAGSALPKLTNVDTVQLEIDINEMYQSITKTMPLKRANGPSDGVAVNARGVPYLVPTK